MSTAKDERIYVRTECAVFRKTAEAFGGLSNMAPGYPVRINGVRIFTIEALYQACRFPHRPEVQQLILGQHSPMTAKMVSKPYRNDSRPDWESVRVKAMRWCLRLKLCQHWPKFSQLLLSTGNRPIVEDSRKDKFWGAIPTESNTLVGMNVLGRLLMELREAIKEGAELRWVEAPAVPNFLLFGAPLQVVDFRPDKRATPVAITTGSDDTIDELTLPLFADAVAARLTSDGSHVKARRPAETRPAMIADLKPYAEYTDSGEAWLGRVPKHWRLMPNRALFMEVKEREYPDEEMLSVTIIQGIIQQKALLTDSSKKDSSRQDKSAYKLVCPRDIAYNKMRAWQGAIGASAFRGIISPAYVVMRLREDGNLPRYFHHLYRTPNFSKEAERWSYGITSDMWSLRPEHFKMIYTPLPPREEQEAIARFLDHAGGRVERAIRAKKKLLGLLFEQKQAIIHRAVTRGLEAGVPLKSSGIPWLGDIPKHWEVWRVSRFAKIGNGSTPSRANTRYWDRGVYPWLNSSQVNRGFIDSADQFVTGVALRECHLPRVPPGSVLVAITGQGKTRGTAALLGFEATINQHVAFITPRNGVVSPAFLHLSFVAAYQTLRALSEDSGSTKGALTCEDLKRFKIALPSPHEQAVLVEHTRSETQTLNTVIARTEREITLLREYRSRLTADVVTGKLDVREAARSLPDEAIEVATVGDNDDNDEESDMEPVTAEGDA